MAFKNHAGIEDRRDPARGRTVPVESITTLLTHFFVGAVGLRLLEAITDIGAIRAPLAPQPAPESCEPAVRAAWMTDAGPLCAWGAYDPEQSQDLHVHVLFIEWWRAPNIHHLGWWRGDPKHPQEWTVGRGGCTGVRMARTAIEHPGVNSEHMAP